MHHKCYFFESGKPKSEFCAREEYSNCTKCGFFEKDPLMGEDSLAASGGFDPDIF